MSVESRFTLVKPKRSNWRRPSVDQRGTITFYSGAVCSVDATDAELLAEASLALRARRDGALITYVRTAEGYAPLHRVLMRAVEGDCVDHIDGDTLNNRRSNLRICSLTENNRNSRLDRRSKTGFKGVRERAGHFYAHGTCRGRQAYLGSYPTAQAAAAAYDAFARDAYGAFACLNFPKPGEQSVHREASK